MCARRWIDNEIAAGRAGGALPAAEDDRDSALPGMMPEVGLLGTIRPVSALCVVCKPGIVETEYCEAEAADGMLS